MSDQGPTNPPSGVPGQTGVAHFGSDRTTRWVAYLGLSISVLTFVFGNGVALKLAKFFPSPQDSKTIIEGIIGLLNIALASFVLIDSWFIRPVEISEDKSPSALSFKQLLLGWRLLWLTWIPFYACLSARWLYHISDDNAFWRIANALNMVNGFFFYYLFFVLDQPSVPTESEPDRAKMFRRNIRVTIVLGIVIFIVSTFVHGQGILAEKLSPAYIAVGMAFFFGRLDSHYLRAHRVLLAPLYLYAVIQLFWGRESAVNPAFDPERVAIFVLAFILKFAIFMTLSQWIRDGRFRKYFVVAKEGLEREC